MPDYLKSIGLVFLEQTKHTREELLNRKGKENITPTEAFKQYQGVTTINLPKFEPDGKGFWESLLKRRSIRKYKKGQLTPKDLSKLLWAAQGITARVGSYLLRTAPSAGALYPIETYILTNAVEEIPKGIYHYNIVWGHLEELALGDYGKELGNCCLGQPMCWNAQVVFIWSSVFRRTMSKYGSRGMRYVFMDVAHICQNVLLAASAMGLGACPIGAFFDDEINKLLGLDGKEESVIYLASVGISKE